MPSLVWERSPQDAYESPYDFAAQALFLQEADIWLSTVISAFENVPAKFDRYEETREKALWMLARDLLESLTEARSLLSEGRYRAGSRFFRDCIETIDLLLYLSADAPQKNMVLQDWYANNPIDHNELIRQLEMESSKAVAKNRTELYLALSIYVHKTYKHLLHAYSENGAGELILRGERGQSVIIPQMVSADLAVLAALIRETGDALSVSGVLDGDVIQEAWIKAMAEKSPSRLFGFLKQG